MKYFLLIFFIVLVAGGSVHSMPDSVEIAPGKKYDMKTYYMVFLKRQVLLTNTSDKKRIGFL